MCDLELAKTIVIEFGKLSYAASSWEKLVGKATLKPHGCLIDALGMDCPPGRRQEAEFYAANALRTAFPDLTRSQVNWERKQWSEADALRIIEVVQHAIRRCFEREQCEGASLAPSQLPNAIAGVDPFSPWYLFRCRPVPPSKPGVYLFAYFENQPSTLISPTDEEVVYIGQTEASLNVRLMQFQDTALGGSGHSGGWTYRMVLFPDDWDRLRTFHNTYVTWHAIEPEDKLTPLQLEAALIANYVRKWGRKPQLNQ